AAEGVLLAALLGRAGECEGGGGARVEHHLSAKDPPGLRFGVGASALGAFEPKGAITSPRPRPRGTAFPAGTPRNDPKRYSLSPAPSCQGNGPGCGRSRRWRRSSPWRGGGGAGRRG